MSEATNADRPLPVLSSEGLGHAAQKPEWQFLEPPELVDMDRLWSELRGLPAVFAYSYLQQLRLRAPLTYDRLRTIRVAAGCTVFAWPNAEANRPEE